MIEGADDVLAVRIQGKITGEDLFEIMNRLVVMLAVNRRVHVYAETAAIDGIEIAGLASHVARAAPLLGKLSHFGRVAVVADQAWVRMLTRIESAILPHISYRVFKPEDRHTALEWVRGHMSLLDLSSENWDKA
ncbi:STAS/SEC14 domain-containing protein [Sphingopyxis sp. BSN-002]|uniref:STAS/SEC14 domain-containing protein n=1 Tax=Sphingopyxis sp. BSN-002 TaxID=2911495 RepID=UPI001EDADFF6|nr:STAS/SEC14 domain-containing protein [Sphingopyxis sp. BSN-002]UKK86269.1 STAS/SEC14 domain-containing protein [Sphingopyxis sp. BSN-002]